MTESILSSALLIWGYVTIIFILALIKKDNSIMDIAWGLGFVVVALFNIFSHSDPTARQIVITALICIWGLRLAAHIAHRNLGKGEDFRYAKWRKDWGKWVIPRSYFQIFFLQGLFMLFISFPVLIVNYSQSDGLGFLDYIGIGLWGIGFFFESIGDLQLMRFKKDQDNKGRIMKTGLWRFTRHPNYFGEVTLWWGIFFLSVSVRLGWLALVSPILVTILLLRVSGVAMLEKKYRGNPDFEQYARQTSAFFPWFPKSSG